MTEPRQEPIRPDFTAFDPWSSLRRPPKRQGLAAQLPSLSSVGRLPHLCFQFSDAPERLSGLLKQFPPRDPKCFEVRRREAIDRLLLHANRRALPGRNVSPTNQVEVPDHRLPSGLATRRRLDVCLFVRVTDVPERESD